MSKMSFDSIVSVARDVGRTFVGLAAMLVGALMRMSLPRLLAVCLVAALILSILPLAITLFFLALIVKLVALAVVCASRREPPKLGHNGDQS